MRVFDSKYRGLLAFVVWFGLAGCVDQDFDAPPAGGVDPDLTPNISIAELKDMHTLGQFEEITEDLVIEGIVISSDEAGNFFRQLIIQDETGGIELRIEATNLFNTYPIGRRVFVKLQGLWLGDFNDLTQLGGSIANNQGQPELSRIPESLLDEVVLGGSYGHEVIPAPKAIGELTAGDVSTLIQLQNVQFINAHVGSTFADTSPEMDAFNLDLEDCDGDNIILRTSGFANFAAEITPPGNGMVTGVLGIFGDDLQLLMRDFSDISFTEARCDGSTGEEEIDQDFNSFNDDDDIFITGWMNVAVKGTRLWRAQEFDGNLYAQATAFNDAVPEMETWLITPAIDTDEPKTLTFVSAQAFWEHDGLTVWASTDFTGDVEAATWMPLDARIAESSDADHAWIPSGNIDLSGFSEPVFIGFKYVGSGPGGETTTYRVDDILVQPQ